MILDFRGVVKSDRVARILQGDFALGVARREVGSICPRIAVEKCEAFEPR